MLTGLYQFWSWLHQNFEIELTGLVIGYGLQGPKTETVLDLKALMTIHRSRNEMLSSNLMAAVMMTAKWGMDGNNGNEAEDSNVKLSEYSVYHNIF